MTPARVLIVRHGNYPTDPRVLREARALVERGHQVDVVCLRRTGEAARDRVDGVGVYRLPLAHRRAGTARYLLEYGSFFAAVAAIVGPATRLSRYDVVQVNTMPDALVFATAPARLAGARVLLDLHEVMPELYVSKFGGSTRDAAPRLLAFLEQRSIRFADAAIAVSQPCLDRYVGRGADPDRFTVVMNSADPALFAPADGAPSGDGGPSPDTVPRVCSHGTLSLRYGFDLLVEAMAYLPAARLEILGEGEARALLERRIVELGLGDRVHLGGFVPVDRLAERLRGAHVGVVANRADPFTDLVVPTKLLEYVALGLPAVVARTPAIEAHFDDPALAWFRPGDARDLARALEGCLHDPAAARARALRARADYLERYAWPVMAGRYTGLVERLAHEARSGGRRGARRREGAPRRDRRAGRERSPGE